jgi:hypothetical protein
MRVSTESFREVTTMGSTESAGAGGAGGGGPFAAAAAEHVSATARVNRLNRIPKGKTPDTIQGRCIIATVS